MGTDDERSLWAGLDIDVGLGVGWDALPAAQGADTAALPARVPANGPIP